MRWSSTSDPKPKPKPNPNPDQVRDAVVEYLALLHADAASLDLRFTGWANLGPP